jgi:hypothetical protein
MHPVAEVTTHAAATFANPRPRQQQLLQQPGTIPVPPGFGVLKQQGLVRPVDGTQRLQEQQQPQLQQHASVKAEDADDDQETEFEFYVKPANAASDLSDDEAGTDDTPSDGWYSESWESIGEEGEPYQQRQQSAPSEDPMTSLGLSSDELRKLPRHRLLDILDHKIKQYGLTRRQQLKLANEVYQAKKHRKHAADQQDAPTDDWPNEDEVAALFEYYGAQILDKGHGRDHNHGKHKSHDEKHMERQEARDAKHQARATRRVARHDQKYAQNGKSERVRHGRDSRHERRKEARALHKMHLAGRRGKAAPAPTVDVSDALRGLEHAPYSGAFSASSGNFVAHQTLPQSRLRTRMLPGAITMPMAHPAGQLLPQAINPAMLFQNQQLPMQPVLLSQPAAISQPSLLPSVGKLHPQAQPVGVTAKPLQQQLQQQQQLLSAGQPVQKQQQQQPVVAQAVQQQQQQQQPAVSTQPVQQQQPTAALQPNQKQQQFIAPAPLDKQQQQQEQQHSQPVALNISKEPATGKVHLHLEV